MAQQPATIQNIVDSQCEALLASMQKAHPDADVGISVALFYPDNPDVPGFYGYGSAGTSGAPTSETVYAIGSVTKVFTATLAAYLSVENVIGALNETVAGTWLTNPGCSQTGVSGAYWDGLTFADLATQTSGMPDEANGPYSIQLFADQPPSCRQIEWWNNGQSGFAGNQGSWIYSSAGFVTLGFALTGAAGSGYTSLLSNVITTPVGMPNTFAADNVPSGATLAQGYDTNSRAVPITDAADLKSSAQDMLAWLAAVYQAMELDANAGTLTPLQQAIAQTASIWIENPEGPGNKPLNFSMGLGWQIPTIASVQTLTKNGATDKGGCTSWVGLTRYASGMTPVGIALMTNQDGVRPDGTAHRILEQIIELG
ncbi:MAG TPA: serine hydrolase domain-containing protein [Candidatus Kapabacteria bacterium]|nr:serine hydrolase domain-containing protein [Candidatus Kapabacteria bacterium]